MPSAASKNSAARVIDMRLVTQTSVAPVPPAAPVLPNKSTKAYIDASPAIVKTAIWLSTTTSEKNSGEKARHVVTSAPVRLRTNPASPFLREKPW